MLHMILQSTDVFINWWKTHTAAKLSIISHWSIWHRTCNIPWILLHHKTSKINEKAWLCHQMWIICDTPACVTSVPSNHLHRQKQVQFNTITLHEPLPGSGDSLDNCIYHFNEVIWTLMLTQERGRKGEELLNVEKWRIYINIVNMCIITGI